MGAVAAVVVVALAGGVWGLIASRSVPQAASTARRDLPPWSLPEQPLDAAKTAGLRVSQMEGTEAHFHTHLDVTVDGQPIAVPAGIGIDPRTGGMSELHTHDERGVLHIEAPSNDRHYTLGQLFGAWQVRFDSTGIGGLNNTKTESLRVYVDGKRFSGDPATVELVAHRQVSVVYGPRSDQDKPAASYQFEQGE